MQSFWTRSLVSISVSAVLVAITFPGLGVAQEPAPTAMPAEAPAHPPPSPNPLTVPASGAHPGATYVGTFSNGAPLRLVVTPDGAMIEWYELGDAQKTAFRDLSDVRNTRIGSLTITESTDAIAQLQSVPVVAWDPRCAMLGNANAVLLKTGRHVPIVDGHFSHLDKPFEFAGTFEGETASGTFSASLSSKASGESPCEASTTWTARVTS